MRILVQVKQNVEQSRHLPLRKQDGSRAQQCHGVDVPALVAKTEVQAASRTVTKSRSGRLRIGDDSDGVTGLHNACERDRGADGFVTGSQPTGMFDCDHRLTRNDSGKGNTSGPDCTNGRSDLGNEIDTAMAATPGRLRGIECVEQHGRLNGPYGDRWWFQGITDRGPRDVDRAHGRDHDDRG